MYPRGIHSLDARWFILGGSTSNGTMNVALLCRSSGDRGVEIIGVSNSIAHTS